LTGAGFSHRLATAADLPALGLLVEAAMARLMSGHLSPAEIESSRAIMGVDSQLVADGTYYVVESEGRLAGGGGWSRRVTMYGGDASPGRDARLLDPAREPMRVRAMSPRRTSRGGASAGWFSGSARTRRGRRASAAPSSSPPCRGCRSTKPAVSGSPNDSPTPPVARRFRSPAWRRSSNRLIRHGGRRSARPERAPIRPQLSELYPQESAIHAQPRPANRRLVPIDLPNAVSQRATARARKSPTATTVEQ